MHQNPCVLFFTPCSLQYNNLPFVFSSYCHKPLHEYATRYKTQQNYVLPCPTTNRGQRSIKFAGPKAWVEVPKQLKEIAFRKPFSKKLKEHILTTIFAEMPRKTSHIQVFTPQKSPTPQKYSQNQKFIVT